MIFEKLGVLLGTVSLSKENYPNLNGRVIHMNK